MAMEFVVRQMTAGDRTCWAELRGALWPEETREAHDRATDTMLAGDEAWDFIIEAASGAPAGFAEVAMRPYANGCDSRRVPFLEGIWIEPQLRRQGLGLRLIAHIEQFVIGRGFREIGSDTQIDNRMSQAAHHSWGFWRPNGSSIFTSVSTRAFPETARVGSITSENTGTTLSQEIVTRVNVRQAPDR
jgi:aminoglycoside 6'-N-acetyltransferase I